MNKYTLAAGLVFLTMLVSVFRGVMLFLELGEYEGSDLFD